VLTAMAAGLAAGVIHVLSGPDHLAAVAPIAAERRRRTAWAGFEWGAGHSLAVLVLGILVRALRERLPLETLAGSAERLVGVVLLAIGFWGLRRALRSRVHTHRHRHDGVAHTHLHLHPEGGHAHDVEGTHSHGHAAFGVGVVHGLAGSSHVLAILPAAGLATRADSLAYLLSYGGGTIVTMTVFAAVIGKLSARFGLGTPAYRSLLAGFSVLAIVVGVFWLAA
jgi:hydrogenase/urease accessory protein HupE